MGINGSRRWASVVVFEELDGGEESRFRKLAQVVAEDVLGFRQGARVLEREDALGNLGGHDVWIEEHHDGREWTDMHGCAPGAVGIDLAQPELTGGGEWCEWLDRIGVDLAGFQHERTSPCVRPWAPR